MDGGWEPESSPGRAYGERKGVGAQRAVWLPPAHDNLCQLSQEPRICRAGLAGHMGSTDSENPIGVMGPGWHQVSHAFWGLSWLCLVALLFS